ncbi:MAG TPA: FtsW/RodA/SpoVE family cell cycle protein [Bacteroidales bacterium]|jgi:cell division protein FtsW|nr:FtsW/RodA/SpoVE family cell cycle protein [Bacteroidales bacterium]HOJ24671.1 FtsW/RodA/SpoVE family cell cycle protein [Bacteroidales bacterium]HQC59513.1 FtsW/RodA/SpoVE family cell cycle protein [Bacteroidales bacterium]
MIKKIFKIFKGDKTIWIVYLFLCIFSMIAVYSTIGNLAFRFNEGNTTYYLIQHIIILIFGIVLAYLVHLMDYRIWGMIAKFLFIIAIPLLIVTLFKGQTTNDAARWLRIPVIGISFQTSDFARFALIILLARIASAKQDNITDFKHAYLPMIVAVAITVGLVFPTNLSTAVLILATALLIMYIARVPLKYLLATVGIVIVIMSISILIMLQMPNKGRVGTWQSRIESFTNKDEKVSYQRMKADIAIANGGVIGKFPGNSTQRGTLPQSHTDFIYAIIIEELGMMGGIAVLLLYCVLMYRAIHVGKQSKGFFGAFLAIGFGFYIGFQAFVNMSVAVGLIPVTGQPLPMISKGGTSIIFTSIAIGIIQSIARDYQKNLIKNESNTEDTVTEENESEQSENIITV